MAQLIWSPRAIRDLDEASEYIARTSENYARLFARGVVALAESIPAQPCLGAVVPEYEQDDLRERQYHSHRIIYRVRDEDIELVTIIHGARRLPRTPPG